MKKKIFLLGAVVGLFLLLTGCKSATTESSLVVTDMKTGAGTKTITFLIPQDRDTVIEVTENEDGSTSKEYTIYNNSSYFPKGYDGFAEWVISQLPDKGYRYEIDATDASTVKLHFIYDFTSYADYTEKTRAIVGEERWTDGNLVDPQIYVTEVTDQEDINFGKLKVEFAESHYLAAACVNTLLEIGFSQGAVDAGVLAPFGNCDTNADCKAQYEDANTEDSWREYCIGTFMITPDNACDEENGPRTYIFEGNEYIETRGGDGSFIKYVENDGTWTVTEEKPNVLGTKMDGAQNPYVLDENGERVKNEYGNDMIVYENLAPGSEGSSVLVIIIIAAIVVVAAVVVVAVIIKKRNDSYEDDDEEDEDDEDGEEEEADDEE